MCEVCNDRHWLICKRDDGREAVERCDACQGEEFSDEQAAVLAQAAGVECEDFYPCYVLGGEVTP